MIICTNPMTCSCGTRAFKTELDFLNIEYRSVISNCADLVEDLTPEMHDKLNERLSYWNLSLMDTDDECYIEEVCLVIINMIKENIEKPEIDYSKYIAKKMNTSYKVIAKRFSVGKHSTIRDYIIEAKLNSAIIMIADGTFPISQIAFMLHFHDVHHLSNQLFFKKGHRPGYYKIKLLKTN